jgi:hypothetical protein
MSFLIFNYKVSLKKKKKKKKKKVAVAEWQWQSTATRFADTAPMTLILGSFESPSPDYCNQPLPHM